jgi:chromosome segregation ATPase
MTTLTEEIESLKLVIKEQSSKLEQARKYIEQVEAERDVLIEQVSMLQQMVTDRSTEIKSLLNNL